MAGGCLVGTTGRWQSDPVSNKVEPKVSLWLPLVHHNVHTLSHTQNFRNGFNGKLMHMVYMCVHMFVCAHMAVVSTCVYLQKPKLNVGMSFWITLHLIFWGRTSYWTWSSCFQLDWLASEIQVSSCLWPPHQMELQMLRVMPDILHGCWELELGFLCSCSKRFTHWNIFPAPISGTLYIIHVLL